MNHTQLAEIGKIKRTHGVNGEVQISWAKNFFPEEHELESVFLQIDGIPIPFFIKSIRNKGESDSLVVFDEVDSIKQSSELVGLKIFAEINRKKEEGELFLEDFEGYTIITTKGVQLGVVEKLHNYSGNLVFQLVNTAGSEMLIPASPNFIIEIDEESQTLIMEIPEGLAEL